MRLDPPLDPTSPQARQWLEDELRKGIYHEQKGLLERIWDWLNELISGAGAGAGGLAGWTIWIAVAVIVAVVALVLVRSLHAERRMRAPGRDGVLDGPTRTAAEHRASAARALEAGDADTAVLEAYRALTRSAIERTLLDRPPRSHRPRGGGRAGAGVPGIRAVPGRRGRHVRRRALRPPRRPPGVGP